MSTAQWVASLVGPSRKKQHVIFLSCIMPRSSLLKDGLTRVARVLNLTQYSRPPNHLNLECRATGSLLRSFGFKWLLCDKKKTRYLCSVKFQGHPTILPGPSSAAVDLATSYAHGAAWLHDDKHGCKNCQ